MIQNPYALDSDGNLVSANAAEKHEIYFCVTCGGKMYLAGGEGKQMQAHFRHESGVEHSGETFLHDYTKRYFAQLIKQSDCFRIGFDIEERCCKEICRFDRRNCKRWVPVIWDLKERKYDKVEIEKPYGDFQPDVLLTSGKYPGDPIFIEIEVTHPCTEEKIRSGFRIIEIKLPEDYDVTLHPLEFDSLVEGNCGNGIRVKFYNFKNRQRESDKPLRKEEIRAIALRDDGKIVYMFNNLDCSEYGKKIRRDSIVEVHLALDDYEKTTMAFKAVATLYGIPCKNCRFCSAAYENVDYSGYACLHTEQKIKLGNEAENCKQYAYSRYNALKWASRIKESAYIVIDKNGEYVFPIFVNEELEKEEEEIRAIEIDLPI